MIPIAVAASSAAFRADVDGAGVSPLRLERFADMVPGDRRQLVWVTSSEPPGLYCADETDPVAGLVCAQLTDGLYRFDPERRDADPGARQLVHAERGCHGLDLQPAARGSASTMARPWTPATSSRASPRNGMPTIPCTPATTARSPRLRPRSAGSCTAPAASP